MTTRRYPFDIGQRIKRKNAPAIGLIFGGWDEQERPYAVYIIRQKFPIENLNDWEPVQEREGQSGLIWGDTTPESDSFSA